MQGRKARLNETKNDVPIPRAKLATIEIQLPRIVCPHCGKANQSVVYGSHLDFMKRTIQYRECGICQRKFKVVNL